MMTSNSKYTEAFVWVWLPEETTPVVANLQELTRTPNVRFNKNNKLQIIRIFLKWVST